MTREEFEELNSKDKRLVVEAYIDGFEAAFKIVKSFKYRTGSDDYDSAARFTTKLIAKAVEFNLNTMKQKTN